MQIFVGIWVRILVWILDADFGADFGADFPKKSVQIAAADFEQIFGRRRILDPKEKVLEGGQAMVGTQNNQLPALDRKLLR